MLLRTAYFCSLATLFLLAGACSQPDRPEAEPTSGQLSLGQLDSGQTNPVASDIADPAMTNDSAAAAPTTETATLGAGCFWCIEAVLRRVDGVLRVVSGYTGGEVEAPTYEQVCGGQTGHAEVVQVEFDPSRLSYARLLDLFFQLHDPTTKDRQGNDIGTQYRSAIFWHSEVQRDAAQLAIARAQAYHARAIVTEVTAAVRFWPAEEYHQDYFAKNPGNRYCRIMIPPKLQKLGLDNTPPVIR